MIYVKDGVVFKKLIPEIYNLFPVIDALWRSNAGYSPTIERASDFGIALRTINLTTDMRQLLFDKLYEQFAPVGYVVTFENRNQHGEHIYIGKEPQ